LEYVPWHFGSFLPPKDSSILRWPQQKKMGLWSRFRF